ncbi:3-oxoacyl-ACP synthase III family protein [Actinomadura syzygii]|uniref:3-oxoacyl-ACP synthase n=1 Tax=Actinomadura syzygii TaxID=1427538 RepID=A0A5D0U9J6_9ACTN|nr:3-oxoacyl-[acyl-carrier-protein] synthase III C-terminal domain-containing protein [Actinomadura syzygii]TYC15028.1 hypothetical protein FXF65_12940 [Actinomadura syzygii]
MRFLAIEHVFPSHVVTNEDVVDRVLADSSAHLPEHDLRTLEELVRTCFASSGTEVRHHRADGETASELTVEVGHRALDAAGLRPHDIDLLIYAGIGRGIIEPASATIYQDLLGLDRATAFDVLDACASWVRALHVANAFLRAGAYRTIMIVNAEFGAGDVYRYELTSLDEFPHWHPTVTIGEAATATILTASPEDGSYDADFRTWGEKRDLCFVPMPSFTGHFGKDVDVAGGLADLQFVSYGLSLLEFGTRKLVEHYRDLPRFEEFKADRVFLHSASDGAARHVVHACGIDPARARFDHRNHANTASASVPVSMSEAVRSGELADGDRTLLMVASSGVTSALTAFEFHGR